MSAKTAVTILLTVLAVTSTSMAMKFQDGTVEVIKSDPNYFIDTHIDLWAFSDDVVTWLDSRVGWQDAMVIGTHLSDPAHTEFLVDPNTFRANEISMDYPLAAYTYSYPNDYDSVYLRLADISNESSISIWPIPSPGREPHCISVEGNQLSLFDSSWCSGVFLIDITDPAASSFYLIDNLDVHNQSTFNTAHDGNILSWCGEGYDLITDSYYGFLNVADISDPENPQINRNKIPYTGPYEWNHSYLNSIDASGDWLVGNGYINDASGVFAIQHYTDPDPNNWNIVELWTSPYIDTGFAPGEPRIDGNIAVWTLQGSGGYTPYSMSVDCKDCIQTETKRLDTSVSHLMGAYLTDNGHAVVSILCSAGEYEEDYDYAADISGLNVVWSRYYSSSLHQSEAAEYVTGTIQLQCGDTGYNYGDINRDCQVNILDMALMAQNWLTCTTPEDTNCTEGLVFADLY